MYRWFWPPFLANPRPAGQVESNIENLGGLRVQATSLGSVNCVLPSSSCPREDHVGVIVRRRDFWRLGRDHVETGSEAALLGGREMTWGRPKIASVWPALCL